MVLLVISLARQLLVGNGKIVVGASGDDDNGSSSGSAYIFDLNGTQLAKITASDGSASAFFGTSVAVGNGKIVVGASGGNTAPVGAFEPDYNTGAAYIFDLDGNQLAKIKASDGENNERFGKSVAVGNGKIVVGADVDIINGSSKGSAYIFDLDGTQLTKITASDGATYNLPGQSLNFGSSVAIGLGRIVVGSYGVGEGDSKGAAYIFDLDGNELSKIMASDAAAKDRLWHVSCYRFR